ncbi:LytR/AlgR family response regulator transcription factor [Mangrovimonas futianensis]|uniref:LytR/AlgR family response regulator transcription factor n=1 Tax=Mangrovimonas futianensis TaxID=2895523 RepID=UPI001E5E6234|nr:LytTR family DNA-binding domain-containing protein [Mangrovimonas futianensis]MCF1421859.1 LytTR family DNA-binding domain-containing protein [Mangrovimonas futianensis]
MNPTKALIVEDNAFMATVLQDMLQQYTYNITLLGTAHSGKEALKLINLLRPNLVFLDIELPDMTGFEMLEQIEDITFKTIFTTAHSQYAIKAFRFNALDYLTKPINENELKEAINRFTTTSFTNSQEQIKNALKNIHSSTFDEQNLLLQTQNGYLKLPLKHIVKIESDRNYSYIHLDNGSKELSSKTLAYFDEILVDKGFFRCHRSFLVNKRHIDSIQNNAFILKNKTEIPISRRKLSEAKRWMSRF